MAKLKIGDIVEIKTRDGLSYAQYTHRHRQFGALLRVFRCFYENRPSDFSEIVKDAPRFMTFFPLSAAVDKNIFPIVGNAAVTPEVQVFPIFRDGVVDPATGKVRVWWLWDGEKEWQVGELTAEQRKLPIREVLNDTMLIERIESDWTPEADKT